MMPKITFKLKQHTPIIHFQHNQHGATLRASEVKPKLDRFISNQFSFFFPDIFSKYKPIIDTYFNNKNGVNSSIPYKMKIFNNGNYEFYLLMPSIKKDERNTIAPLVQRKLGISPIKPIYPTQYFSNAYKIKDKKWDEIRLALFSKDDTTVEIFSYDSNILDLIELALPAMLSITNFGSRQSKGFGCYSEKRTSVDQFEKNLKLDFNEIFKMKITDEKFERLIPLIDKTYKKLRNNAGLKKSEIRDIYIKEGIQWEKEFIKDNMILNPQKIPADKTSKGNPQYVRSMLGLATTYSYPKNNDKTIKIRDTLEEIERFQSPITFKYFPPYLYLLTQDIPKVMFNRKFAFFEGEGKMEEATNRIDISTPEKMYWNELLNTLSNGWNKL